MRDREHRERPPQFFTLDDQRHVVRAMRGRRSHHVRLVLAAFGIARGACATEACANWEYDQILLFWDLLGYNGSEWVRGRNRVEAWAGMIGETKRLIQEVLRP